MPISIGNTDGEDLVLPELGNLRTVKQLARESDVFTEGSLRHLIFHAEETGFAACIIRVGRRVLIDLDRLRTWLAANRESPLPASEAGTG